MNDIYENINVKTKIHRKVCERTWHSHPWLPRDYEQIRQRAQAIYRARGGMMRMTLNDWLKAEQELQTGICGANK